jgi:hypothetical protein
MNSQTTNRSKHRPTVPAIMYSLSVAKSAVTRRCIGHENWSDRVRQEVARDLAEHAQWATEQAMRLRGGG